MSMLSAGDSAPDFTLPSDADGDITLSSFRGRKVILYFYPRDNTPGCTTQACDFRDRAEQLAAQDAVVLGVSKDSLESHGKFRSKFELNFPLLSDTGLDVHKAYGAYGEKMMYGKKMMGVKRTTVVIDSQGNVSSIKHNVRSKGSVDRAIALL
jgi:thioredoxin-dependent peroxiredoxin